MQNPDVTLGIGSATTTSGKGIFVADDFKFNSDTEIKNFEFLGFQGDDSLENICRGVSLYIYEDYDGRPAGIPGKAGKPVFQMDITSSDSRFYMEKLAEQVYDFLIDTSGFVAKANTKYWVVFAPKLSFTTSELADSEMWNWFSSSEANFSDAMIVDPDNRWQSGLTSWYSLYYLVGAELGATTKAQCMALYDENFLSAQNLSLMKDVILYPNPAADIFTVQAPNFIKAEVLDMAGKLVKISNSNTINVSTLPTGFYSVKVTVKDGRTAVKKLIRK